MADLSYYLNYLIGESGSKINLNDIFCYIVKNILFTFAHPLSQFSKVNFVSLPLLFLEVLLEYRWKVAQVREDIIKSVTDDKHCKWIVELISFSIGLVLKGFPKNSKNIDGRLTVRFLKSSIKSLLIYFWGKGSIKFRIDLPYFLEDIFALIIKIAELQRNIIDRLIYVLIKLFELLWC